MSSKAGSSVIQDYFDQVLNNPDQVTRDQAIDRVFSTPFVDRLGRLPSSHDRLKAFFAEIYPRDRIQPGLGVQFKIQDMTSEFGGVVKVDWQAAGRSARVEDWFGTTVYRIAVKKEGPKLAERIRRDLRSKQPPWPTPSPPVHDLP